MDSSKIKIAFTYLAYPVAMPRYILDAFYRRDDVEIISAGPFSSTWIPWKSGMSLPQSYVRKPDIPLPPGSPVDYLWLSKKLPWQPDIWLEGNAGMQTFGRPIGFYAVIGTDPHVIDYSKQRAQADVFFCMQTPYMKPHDVWLPYAYDPTWHTQTMVPWEHREYHASLIGLMYEHRTHLMDALKRKGLNVFYDTGPAYDDARQIYHNTKIGVNWSSRLDTTARVFELMAFGILPILNRVPDLVEMFKDGDHFVGFDSEAEALEKINFYLSNQSEAERISKAAVEAVKPHSWDARVEAIIQRARASLGR